MQKWTRCEFFLLLSLTTAHLALYSRHIKSFTKSKMISYLILWEDTGKVGPKARREVRYKKRERLLLPEL